MRNLTRAEIHSPDLDPSSLHCLAAAVAVSISARRVKHAFFKVGLMHVLQYPHLCAAVTLPYTCIRFLASSIHPGPV